ncbi:MAG: hypothetical protein JEZ07_00005 [Phycisphaerae bacterium]|nr:hypothetical protein [Phycisphaerae bacterium]
MYTVFKISIEDSVDKDAVLKDFASQSFKFINGMLVASILNDDRGDIVSYDSNWYEHCDAMMDFIQNNTEALRRYDCGYHFDIAVHSKDCKDTTVKCMPMDNDFIKLLAEYNITFEISLYLPLER